MTDPQTETAKLSRYLREDTDECAHDDIRCDTRHPQTPNMWCRRCLARVGADALDAQAAQIATLQETVANVGDAIAEYCALNGDKDMPQDQAEAVRFIGREVSTLRAKLAEAERQRPIYVGVDLASGPDYVAHPPVPQCGVAGPHPSNECGVGR